MAQDGSQSMSNEQQQEVEEIVNEGGVKVILLGDSAVGKSKLVERFLMDDYHPRQLSTYALTLFPYKAMVEVDSAKAAGGKKEGKTKEGKTKEGKTKAKEAAKEKIQVHVDFWDTAGQERFQSMHPSYYFGATACILVFDVTRKATYQNLGKWYDELRGFCENIPVICVANKIDVNYKVTQKAFKFPKKHKLPFYFVSAADGTNVVQMFEHAIKVAYEYKQNPNEDDFMTEVLGLLGDANLGVREDSDFDAK